jgi:hypothetical protein
MKEVNYRKGFIGSINFNRLVKYRIFFQKIFSSVKKLLLCLNGINQIRIIPAEARHFLQTIETMGMELVYI